MDRELIVIIEDEEAIAEFVRLNLERAGFRVAWAVSGEDGLGLVRREPPVLVVLDLRLPGMDGLEVCRHLRQFYPEVAVIMLTARGQPLDKVRGLELGADDYITKPFDPRELVARVQAVLRRTRPRSTAQGRVKQFGSLHIDLRRRLVSKGDRILELTPREFDLLAFLAHRPGQVFSRDEILDAVWGPDYCGDPKTVDVHIRRLREKLEDNPARPVYLQTAWGVGYSLNPGQEDKDSRTGS